MSNKICLIFRIIGILYGYPVSYAVKEFRFKQLLLGRNTLHILSLVVTSTRLKIKTDIATSLHF